MSTLYSSANDYQPNYGSRADFGARRPTARAGQLAATRCNLCNQPCAGDEALMDHYRHAHPQAYTQLEALKARPAANA